MIIRRLFDQTSGTHSDLLASRAGGDARTQWCSIFGRLLALPEDARVFPAHDGKGDTVSAIGAEKRFNPRLQVKSVDEHGAPIGLAQDEPARRGWSVVH